MYIVSALSNTKGWNQVSCDPKTQPSRRWFMLSF